MGKMRQRMIDEMNLRGYSPATIKTYVWVVRRFVAFHGKPAEEMGGEEIRAYLLHLTEKGLSWSLFNQTVCGLRLFYMDVLHQPWEVEHVHYQRRKHRKLPAIFSEEDIEKLIDAAPDLKHRTILMTFYSTGIRLRELRGLRTEDIDSKTMTIQVCQAKGGRERLVMLSRTLLVTLRAYYRQYRPAQWLFYGKDKRVQINARTVQRMVQRCGELAGLSRRATPHLLRHCFATHLLDSGTNLRLIQKLLGHKSIKTTTLYTQVSRRSVVGVRSPLDRLRRPAPLKSP